MDTQQFARACNEIEENERERDGIGTLSEKTLHAVLKHYYEPDVLYQEVKVGRYVADIAGPNGIIEIQTQGFNRLRDKLNAFLPEHQVLIVHPIAKTKWLSWIDQETGEITDKRKSPKKGNIYQAFFELYKIRSFLPDPNLSLCFPMLELTEYRSLNGWSQNRKRGSTRYERIPMQLVEEVYLREPADYAMLVPDDLPDSFTSREFAKAVKQNISICRTVLQILNDLEVLIRVGKDGNQYLYERNRRFF